MTKTELLEALMREKRRREREREAAASRLTREQDDRENVNEPTDAD